MFIPENPEKLLEKLRNSSLIVEGKRDKEALERLGVFDVFPISGKPLDIFIDGLERKKYTILTDFDEEGKKKYKELFKILRKNGFILDQSLRREIKDSFGLTKIEELIKFSKLKEDGYHGKVSTINYKVLDKSKFYRKWCSRETRRNWCNIWTN